MSASEAVKFAEEGFLAVDEKCLGCERIVEVEETKYCNTYVNPSAKWRLGICNFATHSKPEIKIVKVRVNPLKAAKRASKRG